MNREQGDGIRNGSGSEMVSVKLERVQRENMQLFITSFKIPKIKILKRIAEKKNRMSELSQLSPCVGGLNVGQPSAGAAWAQ